MGPHERRRDIGEIRDELNEYKGQLDALREDLKIAIDYTVPPPAEGDQYLHPRRESALPSADPNAEGVPG